MWSWDANRSKQMQRIIKVSLAAGVSVLALGGAGLYSAKAADMAPQYEAPPPAAYAPPPVQEGYAYPPPPPPVAYAYAPPPYVVWPGPYYGPYWRGPRFAYGYGRWGYGRWGYGRWGRGWHR
jgi:hypothetical protein